MLPKARDLHRYDPKKATSRLQSKRLHLKKLEARISARAKETAWRENLSKRKQQEEEDDSDSESDSEQRIRQYESVLLDTSYFLDDIDQWGREASDIDRSEEDSVEEEEEPKPCGEGNQNLLGGTSTRGGGGGGTKRRKFSTTSSSSEVKNKRTTGDEHQATTVNSGRTASSGGTGGTTIKDNTSTSAKLGTSNVGARIDENKKRVQLSDYFEGCATLHELVIAEMRGYCPLVCSGYKASMFRNKVEDHTSKSGDDGDESGDSSGGEQGTNEKSSRRTSSSTTNENKEVQSQKERKDKPSSSSTSSSSKWVRVDASRWPKGVRVTPLWMRKEVVEPTLTKITGYLEERKKRIQEL
ncbi:unnamed protein product [Amoebophrya sp. A25]|nr:unnamed protein product [Amoebophrya sp. A25]|eukprot:GSA25T00026741001.1